jgi:hypothetical protein
MRTQISCLLAGLLLCANGGPACAAPPATSENFPTELIASGEISCGQFIEGQRANNIALNNLLVVWVWRFLIDYDHPGFFDMKVGHASDQVDLPDQAAVLLFLEHFCEHNPLSNVYNGTLALLKSRRRSGVESAQTAIVGRLRVRKTKMPPEGGAVFGWWRASA